MRAARLLSILLLLQVNRRVTARELAERLEVSERTVLRDMDALSEAGIPVTAERGTGGGWQLLHEYRTNLTGLNATELQTLFFAPGSRLIADLGLGKAADNALIKLLASLPVVSRQNVAHTRERLHIDGAGWYQSSEMFPYLSVLQEAIWQERQVHLIYTRMDGTMSERTVSPLGLVAKGNIWYMVADTKDGLRSYRVSRVQQAQMLTVPCLRPEGFDLAAFWKQSVADIKTGLPCYPATLRVAPALVEGMRRARNLRIAQEGEPESDGWLTVEVLFEIESEAHDFILRSGSQAEVVKPTSLRSRLCQTARSILALHLS